MSEIAPEPVMPDRPWDLLGGLLLQIMPQAQLFRYSCPICFEFLWSFLDDQETPRPSCSCFRTAANSAEGASSDHQSRPHASVFIIAYDDIPSVYTRPESIPNIHLDTIFSPTTLYMLLGKKLSKSGADLWSSNPIRWIIVDPYKRIEADKHTLAISQLLAPHIQVVDGSEDWLLTEVGRALETTSWDERKAQAAEDHLKLMVTEPGNRHAVSNVVGPVLLGFQPAEADLRWIVSHLRQVLSYVGLAPTVEESVMLPSEVELQKLIAMGSTEFILVDDQQRNGWGQIVKEALGADESSQLSQKSKHGVSVTVHDSPDFLVKKVEKFDRSRGDKRFRLSVGNRSCSNEVLLLDLRLYEGCSLQEEARFFSRVLEVAKRFQERPGLPWLGFSQQELSRLSSWLEAAAAGDAGRSDKIYLEALTLLPRVLALTDLSLPIIIFSSTGQREIAERLKAYGNIITDFEKPRHFGYQSHDILAATRAAFWSSIDKALLLCQGRKLCAEILRTSQNPNARPVDRESWNWARHLELYLDESGTASRASDPDANLKGKRGKQKRFVIAGLLVPYVKAIGEGPLFVHDKMEKSGLRWWPETEKSPYLLKRESFMPGKDLPGGARLTPTEIMEGFFKCLEPAAAAGVCLEYSEDIQINETDNVRLQSRGDNRYRRVLSDLLELVLFDFLPTLKLQCETTLSIFVATRYRSSDEFKGKQESVKITRELFGFDGDKNHQRYKTIEESSILPILFEVLARRYSVPLGIQIEHARGVTLAYPAYEVREGRQKIRFKSPKWDLTRHQHYLADTIASECYRTEGKLKPACRRLFEKGIYEKNDPRFATFMLAARMISRGEIAEALLAMKNSRTGNPLSPTSGTAIIFQNVAKAVKDDLTGDDFLKLVAGLQHEKKRGPSQAAAERGSILTFDEGSCTGTVSGDDGIRLPFKLESWESATFPTPGGIVKFKRSLNSNGKPAAIEVRSIV